jgi:hypothetical protein
LFVQALCRDSLERHARSPPPAALVGRIGSSLAVGRHMFKS